VQARAAEVAKYEAAYSHPDYRLGDRRRLHIIEHLTRLPKGSLLDVSTGRGEVLEIARMHGFAPVIGTEAVEYLCDGDDILHALAHDLPFESDSFDTVTMFDVMEHLLPADTAPVCEELTRVARQRVLLTVHNGPHRYRGQDLHINRRASYDAWYEDLCQHFAPFEVVRHGMGQSISEMFEVIL
jgi:ubiquinone/menaquinone biosynthesis C-methylase UbiE